MNAFESLKEERTELSRRINRLALFIHVSPEFKELSAEYKRLISFQFEFMKAYLLVLELRIKDAEAGERRIKYARWVPMNDGTYKVYCESCGHQQNPKSWNTNYNYCPGCGAEMKGERIWY